MHSRRWISTAIWLLLVPAVACASSFDRDQGYYHRSNAARYSFRNDDDVNHQVEQLWGRHPPNVGRHPPGVGHHPPGVGHHPPGVGHHPPGVGHHPPGVGHHPPGIGHHEPPLVRAYRALQSWKDVITSDPRNVTSNWVGQDVCSYNGVFCGPSMGDASVTVVSGIDLNHAMIGGRLPDELGKLRELGIIHLNTNEFTGGLPQSFKNLPLLTELDVSNNKLSGTFPTVTLQMPSLIYLDIRFNKFYGSIPAEIFNKPLDALFLNNNGFGSFIPETFGNSPVSVVVLANNKLTGGIPRSIGKMSRSLNEIIFLNNSISGPIPSEIGSLNQVEVFDASFNTLSGSLPSSISNMISLKEFNVGNNRLSGNVTDSVCNLPKIQNITLSNNYFIGESETCKNRPGVTVNIGGNCLSNKGDQRSGSDCRIFYAPPAPAPVVYPSPGPPPPMQKPPPRASPPPPKVSPPPVQAPPPQAPPPVPRAPAPYIPRPPPPLHCPSGFQTGNKSHRCFLLVNHQKNWDQAEDYCVGHGGHLAAAASMDELEDLGSLCSQTPVNQTLTDPYSPRGQGCFVGGRKWGASSDWAWPKSSCITFNSSYWNFLEPNDLNGKENCTSIKYEPPILRASSTSPAYMLNDLLCDLALPFICSTSRC